jgi:hypothetical protein
MTAFEQPLPTFENKDLMPVFPDERLDVVSIPALGTQVRRVSKDLATEHPSLSDIHRMLQVISSTGWQLSRPSAIQKKIELAGRVETDLPKGDDLLTFMWPELEADAAEAAAEEAERVAPLSRFLSEHALYAIVMSRMPNHSAEFYHTARVVGFHAVANGLAVGSYPVVRSEDGHIGLLPHRGHSLVAGAFVPVIAANTSTEFHAA